MKITDSSILDITSDNIYNVKIDLANKILKNVQPLFDEVKQQKEETLKTLQLEMKQISEKLDINKNVVEQNLKNYKRKTKVAKLTERIEKLISAGLVHDPSLRHEMIILVKVVDTLDEEKLDNNLRRTLNILSKRFTD